MNTSRQQILLRLDASAVTAIFPEGTEARVNLQNAVIAEFVRKNIKPSLLGQDVADQIERARADALNAIKKRADDAKHTYLAELGVSVDGYSRVLLSDSVRSKIQESAKMAVHIEINSVIREQVNAAAEKLRGTIDHDAKAAVNRLVDSEIREAVKARVAAITAELLK